MTEVLGIEPRWDPALASLIVKETDDWIVSVTPTMIYNDRILFSYRADYPMFWSAGWCYPKGGAAVLAAAAWDPDTQHEPLGYKKVAADNR